MREIESERSREEERRLRKLRSTSVNRRENPYIVFFKKNILLAHS